VKLRIQPLVSSPWFICGAAFLFRLAFLLYEAHLVPAEALAVVPFQNEVGNVAAALARGQGFCCLFGEPTGPTAWLAPGYPFFLAGIFKVFGIFGVASFYVAGLFNCLFSAVVCLPLFCVAVRVGNRTTAALAAWLWGVFPSGILIPFEWIWDSSLSALLAISLLWMAFLVAKNPRRKSFVLYGFFCGLCLLVNPALGSVLPFLLLWIYLRTRSSQFDSLQNVLLAACLALLVCVPWTLRNAVQFHRVVPIRSDYPFELWMGNNPIYDERSREVNRITRYEQAHLYAQLGENVFLEEKGRAAVAFIRSHPALCANLAARRAVAWWLGTPTPWRDFQRTDSALVRFLFFVNGVTLLGTFTGLLVLLLQRSPHFFPVASYPLVFPLVYYVTQVSLRLRHPLDPILALLLAVAASGYWRPPASHANVS
jgi:4-amino-4-deoxy-L-arabinose transferase-like glycosyltransferase